MNKKLKKQFINQYFAIVKKNVLQDLDSFPQEWWDGMELRKYITSHFKAGEITFTPLMQRNYRKQLLASKLFHRS